MGLDPGCAAGFERKPQAGGEPDAPQQPQGVGEQVGLTQGHQLALLQMAQAAAGIHQGAGFAPPVGSGRAMALTL